MTYQHHRRSNFSDDAAMGFSNGDPPSGLIHSGASPTSPSAQRETAVAHDPVPPSITEQTPRIDYPNQDTQTYSLPSSAPSLSPLTSSPSPSLSTKLPPQPLIVSLIPTDSSSTSINANLSTRPASPTSQTHFVVGPPTSTSTVEFRGPSITSANAATPTASSNSTKNLSLGFVVGVILGGLFGLLTLFIVGSWIRRWWNRHHDDEYHTPEYPSQIDHPNPQVARHISPHFVSGGASLSGRGIMTDRATTMAESGAYNRGYAGYPIDGVKSFASVYRSRPQDQVPYYYNPEAYSQYVPSHSGADYQEATRGHQDQHWSEALANMGYTISEPSTPQAVAPVLVGSAPFRTVSHSRPKTTTAAALSAAYAAAASRIPPPATAQRRNSTAYTEEDAYGGI